MSHVTIHYSTSSTNEFVIGISKNGSVPAAGFRSVNNVEADSTSACMTISGEIDLTDGDYIQLQIKNIIGGTECYVRNAILIAHRIIDE
jgi:hypothetical protein